MPVVLDSYCRRLSPFQKAVSLLKKVYQRGLLCLFNKQFLHVGCNTTAIKNKSPSEHPHAALANKDTPRNHQKSSESSDDEEERCRDLAGI